MTGSVLHTPVLLNEVLDGLRVKAGGRYIDCTLGSGGHAVAILERSEPDGRLLGIDLDPMAVQVSRQRLGAYGDRVRLVHKTFAQLKAVASAEGFIPANGVLLDLGMSSLQLERGERGFSFQKEGPLDMRMDPEEGTTADQLVNQLDEKELAEIISNYGEEAKARAVARAIVRNRPLKTTRELAEVVARTVGRRGRIHPATRTFQALRIAVNNELDALSSVLPQTTEVLATGGVLAVITFHSLEDRLVKRYMANESRDCICPPELPVCVCAHERTLKTLTRKPVRPSVEEISRNPRSRSAKLRVALRV